MDDHQLQSATSGNIGEETFAAVEKLTAEEGLSRSDAFARIAEQTGRRAGTVSANYYRIARREGAPLQRRKRRTKKAASVQRRPRATSDAAAALARARESIDELGALAAAQEKELRELRARVAQLDTIRSALKGL